ncbi:ATP-binding protein [Perlucidibaca piscinae]|uniref:ATP-binding protein n=1 Tax=Perlucidibaca piscinae TaxID=392589 RepID=UPI00040228B7|nr:ATP-binding protein [Perlucidibaca piscinae]
MKISAVQLRNFKRFSDLKIKNIPRAAKLVVVLGPNGCGKSSLFDAMLQWYKGNVGFGFNGDEKYFRKDATQHFDWSQSVSIETHDNERPQKGSLYVRTAYRNDPDFNVSSFSREAAPSDQIRLQRIIDNDQTVGINYQRLVYDTMSGVFDSSNNAKTVQQLREELIGHIRESMQRVFGDLVLNNISDPLGDGAFYFEKGLAKYYHYKNLSGGEKAAFDLLLDIHVKKKYFPAAVYCVDEIETHLHTRIQGSLLRELYAVLPAESQLWVTTHSLGVTRAALELANTNPGTVCVIDFDSVDPDQPREIEPSNLGRAAWEKMLSITLDDLSPLMAPQHIVVCEGSSVGSRRRDFDAEIYNRIFNDSYPNVIFVSGGNSGQVAGTAGTVAKMLKSVLPNTKVYHLIDRDDRSDMEVQRLRQAGTLVLEQRNLESYLFSEDAIQSLITELGEELQLEAALQIRANALAASVARGNAVDDVKSASGDIFVELKRLLGLTRRGNNTDEFLRDTMAFHVKSGSTGHAELRAQIFDRLS